MDETGIVILGAGGQLGTALSQQYSQARTLGHADLDIADKQAVENFDWSDVKIILNAAAYTNVDGAETAEGRVAAWQANAEAVGNLLHPAWRKNITIVHLSTDYVFDGTKDPHTEEEPLSPLSSYGASKAAGDLLVQQLDKHYLLRTSWVIGEGKNFVRTMLDLGQKGVNPTVVADQVGRLTFTDELVKAVNHLLTNQAPFGTYNISNDGEPASWADITREIFKLAGFSNTVTDTTTAEYFQNKPEAALRPLRSTLDLAKIQATGFSGTDWQEALKVYIEKELAQ